jgi:uncharacterized protein (TIGR02996 family)
MTEHDALLQAILDDAPRLVYADWREEHGEGEHAEFIRLQLRLAGSADTEPGWHGLRVREEDLLHQHGATWRAGMPESPGIRWQAFRRGFPETVEVEGVEPFLRHARRLFAAPVRHVAFYDLDKDAVGEWVRSRHLARLATLDLTSAQLGDQALLDLVKSRHLRGLRALLLADNLSGSLSKALTTSRAGSVATSAAASATSWAGALGPGWRWADPGPEAHSPGETTLQRLACSITLISLGS